jgi:hypothetical protein
MPRNACELEIDLFCRGMVVSRGVSLDGARSVSRTRAGLGSGLEIAIPTGSALKPEVWVNVPVNEPFARRSPYHLVGSRADGYRIIDERDFAEYPVCARRMPPGAVSGEIIAGLEPIEGTLAAIDRITALGAFPTVSIFRPTVGSAMEDGGRRRTTTCVR